MSSSWKSDTYFAMLVEGCCGVCVCCPQEACGRVSKFLAHINTFTQSRHHVTSTCTWNNSEAKLVCCWIVTRFCLFAAWSCKPSKVSKIKWAGPDGPTWQKTKAVPRLLFMSGTTMLQAPLPFSPVETSDHTISFYISDGFFSHVALCCNGTSTHENTHGKLFEDISPSLLSLSFPSYRTVRIFHSLCQSNLF